MKTGVLVATLCAVALASPLAGLADNTGKDLCLLNSENVPDKTMDILQVIAKLKAEIGKGTTVYTKAELKILNDKLTSCQNDLDDLQRN